MPNKMLIDASHPEETRVVVVRGNRIEEFDFESQDKKQLKGNIYLARVTRVEPSLQAAFVEYGGNRHGFLAFSEIHPDYYQIPVADRQALLRAEAEEAAYDDDEERNGEDRQDRGRGNRRRRRGGRSRDQGDDAPQGSLEARDEAQPSLSDDESAAEDGEASDSSRSPGEALSAGPAEPRPEEAPEAEASKEEAAGPPPADSEDDDPGRTTSMAASVEAAVVSEPLAGPSEVEDGRGQVEEVPAAGQDDQEVESVGAEDALEEVRNRRKPVRRHYKIQEVVKRRQILLVQVVKEERGNKGAALTTYLSLAGRYSVLMPNTARGGGISRKITNAQDRKRLKEVVQDLDVPQGMGVILRTAGESRTKAEIKRDYEYLMRLWENVRNLTLQSIAPALVYEEGSLIKRSVRDLYNKDIDEILVSGEEGYREAKDFMRMLMPSHAKVVQPYRETTPIFVRSGIEAQLDRMLQPQVTLKSGGYIIINQTEALVAIDVNSGRSTKEHSIEETALHTNLEAAEEVARQLRLRDLAGLIVIDFIDMEENRNNRAVEKRLKDHLKNDRARIQLGRISHFGLMEMSRQRIRASVLESTMKPCPHCGGTGHVRSESSVALLVVRAIEEFLLKDARSNITVRTPASTALYVLNHKRSMLTELEVRFGLSITVEADDAVGSQHYQIVRGAVVERPLVAAEPAAGPAYAPDEPEDEFTEDEEEVAAPAEGQPAEQHAINVGEDGNRDRKRRRRRRRRGGRDREVEAPHDGAVTDEAAEPQVAEGSADEAEEELPEAAASPEVGDDDGQARKRRRGKRGGKRNRRDDDPASEDAADGPLDPDVAGPAALAPPVAGIGPEEVLAEATPVEAAPKGPMEAEPTPSGEPRKAPRRPRARKAATPGEPAAAVPGSEKADKERAISDAEPVDARSADAQPADTEPVAARPADRASEPQPLEPAEADPDDAEVEPAIASAAADEPAEEERPRKAGWWKRRSFF